MEKPKIAITFNLPAEVVEMLEGRVPKEKRDTFIEEAIHGRFAMMEQEKLMREIIKSNKARDEALDLIDARLELDDEILQGDDLLSDNELLELDEIP